MKNPDDIPTHPVPYGQGYELLVVQTIMRGTPEQGVSGVEIRSAACGSIELRATGGILLRGLIGSSTTNAGVEVADATTVSAVSTTGNVVIENRLYSRGDVLLSGADVYVLAGGQVKTTATGASVRMLGPGLVFIESAVTVDGEELPPGQVVTSGLVHLSGNRVTMDGILRSTADRVLLNAVTRVEVTGPVLAASDLLLHAGVAADWTLAVLEGDSIQHSDLSGGDVLIIGAGSLQSDGALRLLAGGLITN